MANSRSIFDGLKTDRAAENAKRIAEAVEKGKTNAVVGPNGQIWQTDKFGNPLKAICGKQLVGRKTGILCNNPPGHKTPHKGYGPCSRHEDAKAILERRYRALILGGNNLPNNPLQRHIDHTFNVAQKVDLETPQTEIVALMALFDMKLTVLQPRLGSSDPDTQRKALNELGADLFRLSDLKIKTHRMVQERQGVKKEDFEHLINAITLKLKEMVPPEQRRPVLEAIHDMTQAWAYGGMSLSIQSESEVG